jgi:aspartate carbamoyltransferase catalytic subunit
MTSPLSSRHLIGIEALSKPEIESILETAKGMKSVFTASEGGPARSVKKVPALQGRTVVMLFFEASTRTKHSFELAAKRLSADVVNLAVSTSSASKGESIIDTVRNLEAMACDIIVVRHRSSGVPELLARKVRSAIVNAGDGAHEHPTQALLDMFTIQERLGGIAGRKVVIVGDIRHSRVARSNIWGLTKLGADVTVVGPPTLIPPRIEDMGVRVSFDLDAAIDNADAVMMLRIQLERMESAYFPSIREYHARYGLNAERLAMAQPGCIVMHPGPINRGVEIDSEIADGEQSVILDQVTNGVAIRMSVLYLLAGKL